MIRPYLPIVSQDLFYKALLTMPNPLTGEATFIADGIKPSERNLTGKIGDDERYRLECTQQRVVPHSGVVLTDNGHGSFNVSGSLSFDGYDDEAWPQDSASGDKIKDISRGLPDFFAPAGTIDLLFSPHRFHHVTVKVKTAFEPFREQLLGYLKQNGYQVWKSQFTLRDKTADPRYEGDGAKLSLFTQDHYSCHGGVSHRAGLTLDFGSLSEDSYLGVLTQWFELKLKFPK